MIHKGMLRRLCTSSKETEAEKGGGTSPDCSKMPEEPGDDPRRARR